MSQSLASGRGPSQAPSTNVRRSTRRSLITQSRRMVLLTCFCGFAYGCGLQLQATSRGGGPQASAPEAAAPETSALESSASEPTAQTSTEDVAREPSTQAPPAPQNDPNICIWFPTTVMRDHEGGGKYGDAYHSWDAKLWLAPTAWHELGRRVATKKKLPYNEPPWHGRGVIDCAKVPKTGPNDQELLTAVRRQKDDPDNYLAVERIDGETWGVATNEYGAPVEKSLAIVVYKKGTRIPYSPGR